MLRQYHIAMGVIGTKNVFDLKCNASDIHSVFGKGFPKTIECERGFGNGHNYTAISKKMNVDGEIEYVRYTQDFGNSTLLVFND